MEKSELELKSLLMNVNEDSEKVSLKLNIHKSKIMANRWGNSESSDRLFSWALKSLQMVTAVIQIKRCLLLGRKGMINLDSILKVKTLLCQQKSI